MVFLGIDVGSSSVKASLVSAETGKCMGSGFYPKQEMEIIALKKGWAEQKPETWWVNLKIAIKEAIADAGIKVNEISAIGISYQMHGLVLIDKNKQVLRPSIIWCDSRAVQIGEKAFESLGKDYCLNHYLNSPGNFTASKLKWVRENEPDLYNKIWKFMLPGDYIAMKLSGEVNTTVSGLSEGILWDYQENKIAHELLDFYGIEYDKIPTLVETFGIQSEVSKEAAEELGIPQGTKICYRAGDQPNNAFSLKVLQPGEIAATAGTSGVVYGISHEIKYDPGSRVNTFAHVNHSDREYRLGVLLCINGTGILNSWLKKNVATHSDYSQINQQASGIRIGSDGVVVIPFGNGAERMLNNLETGASIHNLNFNIHHQSHILRAAQEGIVFSFQYGLEIMQGMGIKIKTIRAGHANMFLSPVFRNTLAGISGAAIELYETDGAQGAARAAGVGLGYYQQYSEAFCGFKTLETIEPAQAGTEQYQEAYMNWKKVLSTKTDIR
jgi:xylulokinase